MIQFRRFHNSDPPGIVRIWNSRRPQRGLLPRLTESLLDQYVLSKLYFDPDALLVAVAGRSLKGFAHVGFGPTQDGSQLETRQAVICLVLVDDEASPSSLGVELREQAERYLASCGAIDVYGGAWGVMAPFYRGLYGGSDLPGILESDDWQTRLYRDAGYQVERRVVVWQRTLVDFRAPMSRELLQLRRQFRLDVNSATPPTTWWSACRAAHHDEVEFRIVTADGSKQFAALTAWDLEPLSSGWGTTAAGLLNWRLLDDEAGPGHERLLFVETLKQLQSQGVLLAEIQVAENDQRAEMMLRDLGFRPVDVGVVYSRPPAS